MRAILHLAELAYGEVVQTKEIASNEDIPGKYLPSIIRTLARAGLIRTLRGNQGGVMLARPPEEINLREVIEAVEGPISLVPCMRGPQHCAHEDNCSFRTVCDNLQQMMVDQLENTTFADLTSRTYVQTKSPRSGKKGLQRESESGSLLND